MQAGEINFSFITIPLQKEFTMTLYQFNLLDEREKTVLLWEKAVQLGERSDAEHRITLYQIDNFYVEVFYHKEYNVLRRMRSFNHVDQLRPYLDDFDIEDIS